MAGPAGDVSGYRSTCAYVERFDGRRPPLSTGGGPSFFAIFPLARRELPETLRTGVLPAGRFFLPNPVAELLLVPRVQFCEPRDGTGARRVCAFPGGSTRPPQRNPSFPANTSRRLVLKNDLDRRPLTDHADTRGGFCLLWRIAAASAGLVLARYPEIGCSVPSRRDGVPLSTDDLGARPPHEPLP